MHPAFRRLRSSTTITLLLGGLALPASAEDVRVVATIKPVHSIVSAVMAGVGEPHLIMRGAASPHDFSLRPSDAGRLQDAHVVFLVDHALETSLAGPIATLAEDAQVVPLADAHGLVHRPLREGGHFEVHDHADHDDHGAAPAHDDPDEHHRDHGDHDTHRDHGDAGGRDTHRDHQGAGDRDTHHGAGDGDTHHDRAARDAQHGDRDADGDHAPDHDGPVDMHVWLDPLNAAAMAHAVAAALGTADPENATAYEANATAFADRLDELVERIAADTAHLRGKPFIVFHDAYRHFEDRFGLTAAGSAVVRADRSPGARRVSELREKVAELGVGCVLAEPQFDGRVVEVIIEGSDARAGSVDPLGATLDSGPDLYFTLIGEMAASFNRCLSSG